MRFVIIPPEASMSIDNALTSIDVTGIATNIAIVAFNETDGTLDYNDRPALQEHNVNPSPYQVYINRWMTVFQTATPALQLAQAKAIKNGLIDIIFHYKRRLPFSSGGHQYDTHDEAVLNMTDLLLVGPAYDQGGLAGSINTAFSTLTSRINGTFNQISTWSSSHNTNWGYGSRGPDGILYVAANPIGGGSGIGTGVTPGTGPGSGAAAISTVTVSGGSGTITFQTLDAATAIAIPTAAFTTALAGITDRRNQLNTNRLTKQNAVNALSTIAAVIAYDATAGWSF